jgi:hypothetical protein
MFEFSGDKNQSIARSFRIKEQWLNVLKEEAERQGVSRNSLLNKILQDYATFHRYFRRFGFVAMGEKTFANIIEACPKEELKKIAQTGGSTVSIDFIRTMGLGLDHETLTFVMTQIFGYYGNWFKCAHYTKKGKEIFHLRHDLGENWSFFVAEVVTTFFERLLGKKVKIEVMEGALTIENPIK